MPFNTNEVHYIAVHLRNSCEIGVWLPIRFECACKAVLRIAALLAATTRTRQSETIAALLEGRSDEFSPFPDFLMLNRGNFNILFGPCVAAPPAPMLLRWVLGTSAVAV